MGQYLTRSARLRAVLDTPLSNYRGKPWVLVYACLDCSAEVDLPIAALLPAHNATTVRQVLAKLRCQRCAEPPTADMMVLMGPGEFA